MSYLKDSGHSPPRWGGNEQKAFLLRRKEQGMGQKLFLGKPGVGNPLVMSIFVCCVSFLFYSSILN